MTRTVFYARVSTSDQTLEHQITQAEQAGHVIDEVVADHGVSGVNIPLADRAQGRRLFDMLRRGDTLVVRWVDRLGRNYDDVTASLREFLKRGVIVRTVINNMTFDGATRDPMAMAVRDALIGFMAAMAQAQSEATKEAQKAGIAHKKAQDQPKAYRGRKPSYSRPQFNMITEMLDAGAGPSEIAKASGLTRQTVIRVRSDRNAAETGLRDWGL
ncbi:recombinase family protein [Rhizobium sp. NFR03]|uniref:recombinase family protein n=1 Tax=Rhizobium sp. NFR03 TaxID=1566263 RepID=UPI0008BD3A15|nr:recombinase family protein [Rhizobium sp. NFR03]SES44306.1 Site-specific DNA recombinase [Rhizobium sp. NFR03]